MCSRRTETISDRAETRATERVPECRKSEKNKVNAGIGEIAKK